MVTSTTGTRPRYRQITNSAIRTKRQRNSISRGRDITNKVSLAKAPFTAKSVPMTMANAPRKALEASIMTEIRAAAKKLQDMIIIVGRKGQKSKTKGFTRTKRTLTTHKAIIKSLRKGETTKSKTTYQI
jgi:hypothetical protein